MAMHWHGKHRDDSDAPPSPDAQGAWACGEGAAAQAGAGSTAADPQPGAGAKAAGSQAGASAVPRTQGVAAAAEDEACTEASLLARVAELEAKCAELQREEKYRLAEFDNFRRRTRQEQDELRRSAAKDLLAELLDIEDGFAGARASSGESDPAAWREGIELIARKFSSILEKNGVKPLDAEGSAFDPSLHEALFVADEGDHEGEIVGQVLQRGYLLHDKVLRLAKVKVLRGLGKAGGVPQEGSS
jgi:molecular chaperone GrpE